MFIVNRTRPALGALALLAIMSCASPEPFPGQATPGEFHDIDSFRSDVVADVVQRMQAHRALFVFDIDNTLLQSPSGQFAGSDQWYRWQRTLENASQAKVECVFDVQAAALHMAHLVPTDGGHSVQLVLQLQQAGFDVIALTARSPQFRAATQRELLRNDIDFTESLPRDHCGFPGTYRPGRSDAIRDPRAASYQSGIAMLAGQHKGAALLDLLDRLGAGNDYDYVIFFDDDRDNTNDMLNALCRVPTVAVVFLYTGVDADLSLYDLEETVRIQDLIVDTFSAFRRVPGCDI